MATLFRRKKDGIYYVKYNRHGREVRKSLGTINLRTAKSRMDEYIKDEDPKPVRPTVVTLRGLLAKWESWANLSGKAFTTRYAKANAVRHFNAFAPDVQVSSIDREKVMAYISTRKAAGASPRTINESLDCLRALVSRSLREGWYIGSNPFALVEHQPEDKPTERYLTKEEIDRLFDAAATHGRNSLLFVALGIHAGLRKAEIIAAKWEWIDWEQGAIHVRSGEGFRTKTRQSERTVPLRAALRDILQPYREDNGYILKPTATKGRNRYRYEPKRSLQTVFTYAGLADITPHTLRHTFASQLAISGVDLYRISRWLGHTSIDTTQRYAHLCPVDAEIERWK